MPCCSTRLFCYRWPCASPSNGSTPLLSHPNLQTYIGYLTPSDPPSGPVSFPFPFPSSSPFGLGIILGSLLPGLDFSTFPTLTTLTTLRTPSSISPRKCAPLPSSSRCSAPRSLPHRPSPMSTWRLSSPRASTASPSTSPCWRPRSSRAGWRHQHPPATLATPSFHRVGAGTLDSPKHH